MTEAATGDRPDPGVVVRAGGAISVYHLLGV